jgi:two-component system chemotaxis response regulator CheY
MNVLVIDDSASLRRLIRQMLATRGVDPLEAGNGEEGFAVLQGSVVPDVALVDWNMPIMDGLTFVQRVRSEAAYDGMAILMVTTENEVGRITAALQAGVNEYLMKPFTADDLWSKIALLQGGL